MSTAATLSKWGNSQGIRIPKDLCDLLGVSVGAVADIEADQARSALVITFEQPRSAYHRNRRVSMEELCAGWEGGRVGEEWGGSDVGAEEVEWCCSSRATSSKSTSIPPSATSPASAGPHWW